MVYPKYVLIVRKGHGSEVQICHESELGKKQKWLLIILKEFIEIPGLMLYNARHGAFSLRGDFVGVWVMVLVIAWL